MIDIHEQDTDKDILARMSMVGDLLKLIVPTLTDDVLRAAELSKSAGQQLGERLVEMGAVTTYDLQKALEIQGSARAAGADGIEVLMGFRDEVVAKHDRAMAAAFAALPPTNHGEPR